MNDIIGKDGLEAVLEPYLKGTDGYKKVRMTSDGRYGDVVDVKPAKAGNYAELTIDAELQEAAEKSLKKRINEAVGDNGALDVTLLYGDKQDHSDGMSYYTGTIFEIAIPEFGGSCGGGGRYDKMVGKFTGNDVPACGFSIGFERVCGILLEQGYQLVTVSELIQLRFGDQVEPNRSYNYDYFRFHVPPLPTATEPAAA